MPDDRGAADDVEQHKHDQGANPSHRRFPNDAACQTWQWFRAHWRDALKRIGIELV